MASGSKSNIERIIDILCCFDDSNTPIATGTLIKRLNLSRSTAYGLLKALVKKGYLQRCDHGTLALGEASRQLIYTPLGMRFQSRTDIAVGEARSVQPGSQQHTSRQHIDGWNPELTERVNLPPPKRPAPHAIGFANASLSNMWRLGLVSSVVYACEAHSNLVQSLAIRHASDDAHKQITQIDELLDEGMDALIVSAADSDSDALGEKLEQVIASGIPVVAVDRQPKNKNSYSCFVTASDLIIGRSSALWLAEYLGWQGKVWLLSGLKGALPAVHRQKAALDVFAPGDAFNEAINSALQVERVEHTQWTEASGYQTVSRLLDEVGTPPDGVWCDSGLQGVGVLQAFVDAGVKVPPMTGGDLNKMYKLALQHKVPFMAADYPAAMGARALEVVLDLLASRTVPRWVETPLKFILPQGMETTSIKADQWAERHVHWDLPDEAVLSQGHSLQQHFYPSPLYSASGGSLQISKAH